MPQRTLTLAFVSDAGLFLPSLLAAHSALDRAARPVDLLFVGLDLAEWMWQAVARLQALHPQARVTATALPPQWLAGAVSPKDFITATALGRLFLPRLAGGLILYLDGDTLVTGDLTLAAGIDLRGNLLGAVRDYGLGEALAQGKTTALDRARASLGAPLDLGDYVNSGVLLMDADAIRATPGLMPAMEDMAAAQGHATVDQDRINLLFAGRILHLDPAWNASWGRLARQRRVATRPVAGPRPAGPLVIHFHGPNKPWHDLRLSSLRKGGLAVLAYRRAMRRFRRDFPDLPAFAARRHKGA